MNCFDDVNLPTLNQIWSKRDAKNLTPWWVPERVGAVNWKAVYSRETAM